MSRGVGPDAVGPDAVGPAPAAGPWLRSPAWDGVWALSVLWLVPAVLLLAHGHDDAARSPVDTLYFGLTALFWIGHRLGSTWLAYGTTAYRPLVRAQPVRFVVVPASVTAACFALFLPADDALPWSRAQRLAALAILDYALVTYHFAAQHFGALCLYRARAGRGAATTTRRLDRWYALGVGGVLVFVAEVVAGTVAYPDLWVNRWVDPRWVAAAQPSLRTAGTAVLAAATLVLLGREARPGARSLPRALYVLSIAAMVALALHARSPFLFLVVWTAQHWMFAVGLTVRVAAAEPEAGASPARRLGHALNRRPWALLLGLAAASVLAVPFFEVEANRDGGTFYGDRLFGAFAAALRTSTWVPALVALGFATAFVHYLLDRAVYRFSDPRVREAARGLVSPTFGGVLTPHAPRRT